nr:MAG TPA: Photosystem II reaction centre T protein [Caudoviricetes sp.]
MDDFIYSTLAVMSTVILLFCVFFSDVADFCLGRPGRILLTALGLMLMALAILGMGARERKLATAREKRRNRNEQGHIDRQAV